jgi:uncharacterized protein (TIGR00266 family)
VEHVIENRPVFTTLKIRLAVGETVRAEGGAMVSMSPSLALKSKTQGRGLGGMIKAAIGGEGFFASEFTAEAGAGELVLAPPTPGDILVFTLQGQTLFAQGGAYLAGSTELEISTQGSLKALVSGEGLFLQKIKGVGTVFLASYGALFERQLAAGEHYIVDTGHLVAFEETVTYTIRKAARSLVSTLISREGLVGDFEGPGKLWIQSRNLKGFAQVIQRLLPNKSS